MASAVARACGASTHCIPPCSLQCSYAPYRLDTDARVTDAMALNSTASEWLAHGSSNVLLWDLMSTDVSLQEDCSLGIMNCVDARTTGSGMGAR